jgi:transposase-like protein
METKKRGPRGKFTEEFKREAVRLVETGERSVWRVVI